MVENTKEAIKRFIKSSRKMGNDDLKIKNNLLKDKFGRDDVTQAFIELDLSDKTPSQNLPKPPKPNDNIDSRVKEDNVEEIKPKTFTKQKKHFDYKIPLIFVGVILVVSLIFFIFPNTGCSDDVCFTELANNCEPISYLKTLDSISYNLDVLNDCSVVKTIVALNETEPVEVRDLFLNKSMTCYYEKGNFPIELVESLSLGIVNCEGELKDNLLMVIALEE